MGFRPIRGQACRACSLALCRLQLPERCSAVGRSVFVLAAAQQIAQREDHAQDHHEQHKNSDEVAPSEHHVAAAPLFAAAISAPA